MALKDDIIALPSTVADGATGHLGNHATIHAGLKDHETRTTALETRVPSNLALTTDATIGTRIMIGGIMVYGNIGWRNIFTSSVAPSWGVISGAGNAIAIRRDNNVVRISFAGYMPGTDDGVRTIFTLPAGYRPATLILSEKIANRDTANVDMEIDISPSGVVTAQKMPANARHFGTINFITGDAWPTILP